MIFAFFALVAPLIVGLSWKSLFRGKFVLSAEEYLLGMSIILIGLGFCAWYAPNQSRNFIFCLLVTSILILVWQINRKMLVPRRISIDSSLLHFFLLVSFFFIFVLKGNIQQRFFVNPDPYGYASVTGLIKKYDGLPKGLRSIETFTGVPFSYGASWTDPNQFALIASPFHIPDFLIKYGVSNGMFFHNAGSVIGLLFGSQSPREFFVMWAVVTIIAISLIISLCSMVSVKLVMYLTNLNDSERNTFGFLRKWISNSSSIRKTVWFINILVTSIFLGSVWLIPMVWEGYLNQFVSYSLILGVIIVSLRIGFELVPISSQKNLVKNRTNICPEELTNGDIRKHKMWIKTNRLIILELVFNLILLVGANIVAYAQQIPWQILTIAAVILFFGWEWVFSNVKNFISIFVVLSALVAIAFTLPQTKRGLAMFLGGGESAGGSMHLGAFNPIRVFFPLLNFDLIKVTNPGHDGAPIFKELIWNDYFGSGSNATLRGQGYVLLAQDIPTMYLTSSLLLLVLLMLLKIIGGHQRFVSFIGICFVLTFANMFYLFTSSGPAILSNMNKAFNDYMWTRLWAVTSIFYVPIFATLLTVLFLKYFLSQRKILFGLAFSLLFTSANYATQYAGSLNSNSISSSVSTNCPDFLDDEDSNYFVSKEIVPVLGITVCGAKMDFLSDSFPSKHGPGHIRNVFNITRNKELDSWVFQRIGTLKLTEVLTSPCDLHCVISLRGFVPQAFIPKSS